MLYYDKNAALRPASCCGLFEAETLLNRGYFSRQHKMAGLTHYSTSGFRVRELVYLMGQVKARSLASSESDRKGERLAWSPV